MATIVVLGTFDTKGIEHRFLAERVRELGHDPLLVDGGGFGVPQIEADIPREAVAAEGGSIWRRCKHGAIGERW